MLHHYAPLPLLIFITFSAFLNWILAFVFRWLSPYSSPVQSASFTSPLSSSMLILAAIVDSSLSAS
jgi:hypothetical protein